MFILQKEQLLSFFLAWLKISGKFENRFQLQLHVQSVIRLKLYSKLYSCRPTLSEKLAEKDIEGYPFVISWLRTRTSFEIL